MTRPIFLGFLRGYDKLAKTFSQKHKSANGYSSLHLVLFYNKENKNRMKCMRKLFSLFEVIKNLTLVIYFSHELANTVGIDNRAAPFLYTAESIQIYKWVEEWLNLDTLNIS